MVSIRECQKGFGFVRFRTKVLWGFEGYEGFVVEVFREVGLGMDDGEEKRVSDRAVAAKMEMFKGDRRIGLVRKSTAVAKVLATRGSGG